MVHWELLTVQNSRYASKIVNRFRNTKQKLSLRIKECKYTWEAKQF